MRRVVRLGGSPEAGQLVELGGLLFSSSITGVDPASGQLDPNPTVQIQSAFRKLTELLAGAGVSAANIGLVRIAVPSAQIGEALDAQWHAAFPSPDQPASRVDVYPLPEGQHVQLQIIASRGATREQISGWGEPGPDPRSVGVRLGPMVFSSSIAGVDPGTGRLVEDPHRQVRQAFRNLETIVQRAGGTMDDVAHVFIYVRDRADNDDVLEAFLEAFPQDGNRTARKNIYDETLKGTDIVVRLQMIAVIGQGPRQNYEVPGAAKRHPNPLGTRIGSLLFSAGIGGHDPAGREVERQVARALSNVQSLMAQAGSSLADVGLVTFTVDDYAHTRIILDEWRKRFPDPADEPARHIMAFGGRDGSYQIQVHVVAVLGGAPPR